MANQNKAQMKIDGKKLPNSSSPAIYFNFLFTLLVLVPILILLIPFVILFIMINILKTKLSPKKAPETNELKKSSASEIIKKDAPRQYDLVCQFFLPFPHIFL
jgi:flagellar biosynthesis protein FliP